MIVYYRLSHAKSSASNPPPIYAEDQFKLNELSLTSYILGYGDIKPKTVFICDFCPKELYQPLLDKFPFEKEIYWTEKGINETCLMQYELAEKQDDDVLFQECDYLHRPMIGTIMERAIQKYGLVSPYDNLNFYIDRNMHSPFVEIDLINNQHFRTVERSTMTFGMSNKMFKDNVDILKKWGYLDADVWFELSARNAILHVPIPSLSTHLAKDFMAPGLEWQKLIDLYGK